MRTPLVTVLMPVYNGESYLNEAIESILNQTYLNFEFLIINDGSTDKSKDVINSFTDARIRLVDNDKNEGLIYTLNRGLMEATGDYIVRMDQDDISSTNRLSVQVAFMEKNTDVGICGSAIKAFGKNDVTWKRPSKHDEIIALMLFETGHFHPSVIMRASIIKQNNLYYNTEFIHAEDYGFWINCSNYMHLANIEETLLLYRLHNDSYMEKYKEINATTAQKIRLAQLIKLGLRPSKTEESIHEMISSNIFEETFEFCQMARKWICKIYRQNKLKKCYHETELDKLLKNKFCCICLKCNKNNLVSSIAEWLLFIRIVRGSFIIKNTLRILKSILK